MLVQPPGYDHDGARRRHRRVVLLSLSVVVLVLLVTVASSLLVKEPDFEIASVAITGISIPSRTLYMHVQMYVDNPNGISAHLLSVEGDIINAGQKIGDFYTYDEVLVPAHSNFTVDLDVRVDDLPMPLPDPVLVLAGKARLRVWIVGITYPFEHSVPLTYSPDRVNQPPEASIDSQPVVRRAVEAEFDGSGSTDPDGLVVGWSWDFGDGYTAEGAVVKHAYRGPGTYDVVLTVVDQMGAAGTATASIRVMLL